MFDKLIVCGPENADIRNRRSYFMVSSLVVGIVFLAAVVFSIYAADYGLGNDSFELSMVVAPPELTAVSPEAPRPQQSTTIHSQNQLPIRQVNMLNMNETPKVPETISVVPNSTQSRPDLSRFKIGLIDTNPYTAGGAGRTSPESSSDGNGLISSVVEDNTPVPGPPPVKKPPEAKPAIVRSEGPINGKATYLPKPPYPAAARAINLQGKVDVQVLIDETGKVVSANAVSGHSFFQAVAERAAWQAKFSPTYLAKVPVKVTGVIVYNFTR